MELDKLFNLGTYFEKWDINPSMLNSANLIYGLAITTLIAWLVFLVARKIMLVAIHRMAKRTATHIDDLLIANKFFHRIAHLAPAIVLSLLLPIVLSEFPKMLVFIENSITIYIVIMIALAIDALINTGHHLYQERPVAKDRPIKGFIQVIKILLYFIAVILILSVILDKEPKTLLTGLGALAAVLMLVFRDTILGFVAGIQLAANNMVKIGDWISMPKHGADGTVLEITLNTVKVQNWDKTISTIPTYALISESFNNWRGMEESGGRRIKRSINIDMKSVKFCSHEMLEKFKQFIILRESIEERQKEIEEFNKKNGFDETSIVNGRRQTNLGVFRKYLELYLRNHPKINQEMTFLVRHLQPSETGIPIEIYVFSSDKVWANYESIQADIFDHILAVIPLFELRVFQNPTGDDFRLLGKES